MLERGRGSRGRTVRCRRERRRRRIMTTYVGRGSAGSVSGGGGGGGEGWIPSAAPAELGYRVYSGARGDEAAKPSARRALSRSNKIRARDRRGEIGRPGDGVGGRAEEAGRATASRTQLPSPPPRGCIPRVKLLRSTGVR